MRAKIGGAAVVALLVLGGSAPRGDEPKVEGDLKTMQGTWTSPASSGKATWVIKGDRVQLDAPGRKYDMRVKLDPKARPHPSADFTIDDGPEDAKGKTTQAIYKLDGADRLSICIDGGQGTRPTEFRQSDGQQYLFELKRKK